MRRVQAQNLYFFSEEYFEHLMSESEGNVELFVTLAEGQVVSAALFLVCNDIVQYHLAGTRQEWTKLAPMKLIIDTVRQWAVAQGKGVFHLGGGVGSQEDSLFAFKAGFSPHRHTFSVWQWIPLPEIYAQICTSHIYWQKQQGLKPKSLDFFPAYRVPLVSTNQT
jgi:lipid II:glycine glycyltransferase (peptidoglycan interpeptide bridge formation enzyme)